MVVTRAAQFGSVGGGNLEHQAIAQARKLLAEGTERYLLQDYPLGPLLGQCCGGHARVLIESLGPEASGWLGHVANAEDPMQIRTRLLDGGRIGPRAVERADGAALSPAPVQLVAEDGRPLEGRKAARADCAGVLEIVRPETETLVLFGAGHVGQALAHILKLLPFRVLWRDDRADAFPAEPGARFDAGPIGDPGAAVAAAPPGALYLVMTHNHDLDYRLVEAILGRGDYRYCGLIGSRTKRARFEKRLREAGLAPTLGDLVCPIGAQGPRSKAPEAIAVATAAELLTVLEAAPAGAAPV